MCMPPSPPTQPVVMAVSDTELALSWQQGESEGSSPVLHFLVAYIRLVIIDSSASSDWPFEPSSSLMSLLIHSHAFTGTYVRTYVRKRTDAITHRMHTFCMNTIKPAIIKALRRRRAAGNGDVMEGKSRHEWKTLVPPQAGKRTIQKPLRKNSIYNHTEHLLCESLQKGCFEAKLWSSSNSGQHFTGC